MRLSFVFLVLLTLSGCAPRGAITIVADAANVGQRHTMFVVTDRVRDPATARFTSGRAAEPSFARYTVSVPPKHEPGTIEWPRRQPDPQTDFITTQEHLFPSVDAFSSDLKRAMRAKPKGQREAVIFVHGYNNTFAEGLYRLAQMTHDYSLPGVVVHYSWPSAANPLGYVYDRDSVMVARDGLSDLITRVRATGAERVMLVAHSVGSLLSMEALRQMEIARPGAVARAVDSVVLVSPDIDVDLFNAQARKIGSLPQPFVIFTSKRDRALALSARLTGQRDRVGNVADPAELAELDVTLIDVSNFTGDRLGHFVAATSPALIAMLANLSAYDASLQADPGARLGLIPGTVLTIQNVTQIILPALP